MAQINLFWNSYLLRKMIQRYLFVKKTSLKGRGVFTRKKIDAGVVIESSPVIVMSGNERILLDKTLLHDYIFEWGTAQDRCCVALGLVSLYNHNYKSNCEYFMDFYEEIILIKTIRVIEKGEEVTINYNGNWNDEKKLWFDAQ